jgi:signal recognition particle subunit SRP54
LDVWRPAAFEQLRQLGQQLGVEVFGDPKEKDPAKVFKKFEKEFSRFEMIIVDTAGRDALSEELIEELKLINKTVNADETLLVMGADVGQAAELQARTFHEHCGVNGVIITKLDGTAKGGGALSACAVTGAAVKFIGLGEKINDLETFDPKGFVSRLLGMGDLKALLAKADEAMKGQDQEAMAKRIMKGEFTLIDLYDQMKALRSMGPLNKVMELIPGFSSVKMPKELLAAQEGKLEIWKYLMDSCTREELEDPEIIDYHRIERIAKGSGCDQKDLRELLKQYRNGKKMMKMFQGGNPKNMDKMMKRMGGMKGMMNSMGGDMGKLQDAFKKMK